MRFVFICSPLRGDFESNIEMAKEYARLATDRGLIPIAPHLYFPQFLDDNNAAERALGIKMGLQMLKMCDEFWIFGDNITEGMQLELDEWRRLWQGETSLVKRPLRLH